jgi:hypothetical protein
VKPIFSMFRLLIQASMNLTGLSFSTASSRVFGKSMVWVLGPPSMYWLIAVGAFRCCFFLWVPRVRLLSRGRRFCRGILLGR